jgi:hypothetical protein
MVSIGTAWDNRNTLWPRVGPSGVERQTHMCCPKKVAKLASTRPPCLIELGLALSGLTS